jgi:hypothetical protein
MTAIFTPVKTNVNDRSFIEVTHRFYRSRSAVSYSYFLWEPGDRSLHCITHAIGYDDYLQFWSKCFFYSRLGAQRLRETLGEASAPRRAGG